MASCGRYGCEREECKTALFRQQKQSKLKVHRGERANVGAAPAGAHCRELRNAGMSLADIAQKASVARGTVGHLVAGRVERIHRDTERAILAIPLPTKEYRPELDGMTDALAARRITQALSARGFSLPVLAREMKTTTETIGAIRQGRRAVIRVGMEREIFHAYRRMWDADPLAYGIARPDSNRAKAWAKKAAWAPPAAWNEEDLRNPEAKPKGLIKDRGEG